MIKFKAGDKVYYPSVSSKVFVLKESNDETYPVILSDVGRLLTDDGRSLVKDNHPLIFHATEENHALLEALYRTKFEKPKPTPKEVTQKMLKDGWRSVPIKYDSEFGMRYDYIYYMLYDTVLCTTQKFEETALNDGRIVPFDPRTGKTIVDYVDGEIILEDYDND